MTAMNDLLPTLIVMRRELQLLTQSVAKMCKTHAQRLTEEWNRKAQVLKILGISPRTLDQLIRSGLLPCSKINGLIYIKTSDIERLLNKNYVNHCSTFHPTSND